MADAFSYKRIIHAGESLTRVDEYGIVLRQKFLKCECGICFGRNVCADIVNVDRNTRRLWHTIILRKNPPRKPTTMPST